MCAYAGVPGGGGLVVGVFVFQIRGIFSCRFGCISSSASASLSSSMTEPTPPPASRAEDSSSASILSRTAQTARQSFLATNALGDKRGSRLKVSALHPKGLEDVVARVNIWASKSLWY
ncbi:hypothetical protein FIBSPDRAFT_384893 [Athelia psychrophila]|uniref:Uncharacterized protein n=1 Tax=Athelia psychrophila TaxID=1759441 RepID=A0A166P114_9AGAM|nr:hypothetical protein FIBSPDRAFT_384893 [Fibularhizoctonia sp. CBS 109695]